MDIYLGLCVYVGFMVIGVCIWILKASKGGERLTFQCKERDFLCYVELAITSYFFSIWQPNSGPLILVLIVFRESQWIIRCIIIKIFNFWIFNVSYCVFVQIENLIVFIALHSHICIQELCCCFIVKYFNLWFFSFYKL